MKKIHATERNLRELLTRGKFSIDYYQREYQWGKTQVDELLEDLTTKFMRNYAPEDTREKMGHYDHYFLGSIVISDGDSGTQFIIDGQQRLTSMTLLLIHLCHKLPEEREEISTLIYSKQKGKRSFKLDVPDRNECMDALFRGEDVPNIANQPTSIVNIVNRLQDIKGKLDSELQDDKVKDINHCLPQFLDWLLDYVYFVEIVASSKEDAHAIFEAMNDRGLSLTPTEMLKGYLLSKIGDDEERKKTTKEWDNIVESLKKRWKEGDAEAIKAWLRSQYAEKIRGRKKNASPEDFDKIGTEFHRWIQDRIESSDNSPILSSDNDYGKFISGEMNFYTSWYKKVREVAGEITPKLNEIYYNDQNNFTLQFPALLAPLVQTDCHATTLQKLRMVAAYLDIILTRRIWNKKATSYNTMQYSIELLIKAVRGKSIHDLTEVLTNLLSKQDLKFAPDVHLRMDGSNGPKIRHILARMMDFVTMGSSNPSPSSRYAEYVNPDNYDIEHIWANKYEEHQDEFDDPTSFDYYRNKIGGLLLMPKRVNRSLSDKPYGDKLDVYLRDGDLLTKSLHKDAYVNNPGFLQFGENYSLPFQPHPEFKKADLDTRQELYRQLAEKIWDPAKIKQIAEE